MDPLATQFDAKILNSKRDGIYKVWQQFEKFAHHGGSPDVKEFANCLELLERAILDLLAPITAQDQQEIRSILERTARADADIERIFTLMERRGANCTFFFDQATDPSWIPSLRERGYFPNPPNLEQIDGSQVNAPYWWPIHYLSKVTTDAPDEVVEIILGLPRVDNPRVKLKILGIAWQLPGVQSAKLKPKVLDLGKRDLLFLGLWYPRLLTHW